MRMVCLLVLRRGSQDSGGDKGQSSDQGRGETHIGRIGWVGVRDEKEKTRIMDWGFYTFRVSIIVE